jgi:hypothetical protein
VYRVVPAEEDDAWIGKFLKYRKPYFSSAHTHDIIERKAFQ